MLVVCGATSILRKSGLYRDINCCREQSFLLVMKNERAATMRLTIVRVMICFDITFYANGMWCQIVMKSISYGDMNCHKAQGQWLVYDVTYDIL